MKVAGIIAEFNPLHKSHKYLLDTASSENDITAVILGGNFMQRGEAAICDCYDRAEMAVNCGADIVLLLPYVFSAQTAEVFAWGGVGIAEKIGADSLYCGAEDNTLPFYETASLLYEEPAQYRDILSLNLRNGMSFASSRENAVREMLGDEAAKCLRGANNILATEYTRAIIRKNSKITPTGIKRVENSLSATSIRKMLADGRTAEAEKYLPEKSAEILRKSRLHFQEDYSLLLYHTLLVRESDIHSTAEVEQGLHNRLIRSRLLLTEGTERFCGEVSTKRYTKSRIRRILYNCAMGYTSGHLLRARTHTMKNILALAANKKGREFIRYTNSAGNVSIISNLSKHYDRLGEDKWIYDMEIRAYGIYHKDTNCPLLKKHCIITETENT